MVAGGLSGGDSYGGYRMRLVETLQAKGIHDLGVLRAVSLVPRHLFVPESVKHRAYEDTALPIGGGQTISQPWVQARYIEVLRLTGKENVLEVGTGRATRRRCWRCWPTGCSASSGCLS
jgi:protein-L-isoaspartate(D-aspartate) O-methyltransferase